MSKFLVRLFVACTCFVFSLGLTSLSKLFRSEDSSVDVVAVKPAEWNVDFRDEIQIREIYSEYGPAQTRHDRAFFERVETNDFRLFVDDRSLSREEDIQWMESMPRDVVYDNQVGYIKIFGKSAVAHGRMMIRYSDGHVEPWSYVDVWVKRGDGWQIRSTTSNQ